MRKRFFVLLSLFCFCLIGSALAGQSASEKNLVGSWSGSWTGDSNGTFEMTITKNADGKLGGTITPKPDGGESYTTPLTAVVLADGKATIKLADPAGEVEVTLVATFDGSALNGTYSVRQKADGNEVDKGSLKATKKQ
ncbi:MAG: hypothetical protein JST85_20630 [Acidobacteria bacterium]|nr:hypothetical protein [Acidobacteriota bacterium]